MITFSTEQDQYLLLAQTRAYYQGLRDGIERFSWWQDGTKFVGTDGQTLLDELEKINKEEQSVFSLYRIE